MRYFPQRSPDLCWEAVRTCPPGSDSELTSLCEHGPANYINISSSKLVYRNQFCAMCHMEDLSNASQPNDLRETLPGIGWNGNRIDLQHSNTTLDYEFPLLAALKPQLQTTDAGLPPSEQPGGNSFTSFDLKSYPLCSAFMDEYYDYCDEQFIISKNNSNESLPVWDLGSVACLSQYPKVCDLFIVSKAKAQKCTTPGCGPGAILDPYTLKCHNYMNLDLWYSLVKSLSHTWHSHDICAYQSQCRAAELGLVKLEHLNCYCDQFCIYFNDCCEDSKFQATKSTKLEDGTFKCYEEASDLKASASDDLFYWGIMQVDRCPSSFTNETIRAWCEDDPRLRYFGFGILGTPVSHMTTGLR